MYTLTPAEEKRITQSFQMLSNRIDEASVRFYDHLFEIAPQLKPLFVHVDMDQQGMKIMQTIGLAVRSLPHLREVGAEGEFVTALELLGKRHIGYGAAPQHYEFIQAALLRTLAEFLGEDFTPEIREAWQKVYQNMTEIMFRQI